MTACLCLYFSIQVNEYLKDVMAQEQKKKETQSAEQTGGPRVGAFTLFSTLTAVATQTLLTLQTSRV